MGCYSVSGSVSNLPINDGDKVVFWILKPSTGFESDGGIEVPFCSNLRTNDMERVLMTPAFLPIYGEYDDYGSLVKIVEDDNTLRIEQYFSKSISEVVNMVTDESSGYFGMFEHRSIYEKSIVWGNEYTSAYSNANIPKSIMDNNLKMVETGVKLAESPYMSGEYKSIGTSEVLSSELIPDVVFVRRYSGMVAFISTTEHKYVSSCKALDEYLIANNIEHQVDFNAIASLTTCQTELEDIVQVTRELLESHQQDMLVNGYDQPKDDAVKSAIKSLLSTHRFGLILDDEGTGFIDSLISEFLRMISFENFMRSANKLYFPAYCGEQTGNIDCSQAMLDFSSEILESKRKERG